MADQWPLSLHNPHTSQLSLLHLMCGITHAHTSTRTTSLMCVRHSMFAISV